METEEAGLFGPALLLLLLAGAGLAQAAEEPVVLAVEIAGNHKVTEETILRAIANIRLGEPLDENAVRKDLQAIRTSAISAWSMRM